MSHGNPRTTVLAVTDMKRGDADGRRVAAVDVTPILPLHEREGCRSRVALGGASHDVHPARRRD